MISLAGYLQKSSYRQLELIARAHKIAFTRRIPKADSLEQVLKQLDETAVHKAFETLTAEHIEALQALVIAGGWLPLPLFTHHFGRIRLYRPWHPSFAKVHSLNQEDNPRHPWRYPISVAERLYHLGFIHIRDQEMVGITSDVLSYLPDNSVPDIDTASNPNTNPLQNKDALLRDLSALLGTLMRLDLRSVYGRWFNLTAIRTINQSFQIQEDLSEVRSELQSGRLRWLHYLAQVTGLVSVQAGFLKPTVEAWRWLSVPASTQWSALMMSVERDLEARNRLWDIFRFPEVDLMTWQTVRLTLNDLNPDKTYRVKDFIQSLKPYLLETDKYSIAVLLRDMFQWSGIIIQKQGRIYLHQQSFSDEDMLVHSSATITQKDQNIVLYLPDKPHPEAFVELLSFARIDDNIATINAESMRIAVGQGFDLAGLIATLTKLTGEEPASHIVELIRHWVSLAKEVMLEACVVLSSENAAIMQQVRSDWRLNAYFGERLSDKHVVVQGEKVHEFISRLEKREIYVTSAIPEKQKNTITDTLNPAMAEYLLLAVQTYQKLHSRLNAGIRIPKALTQWLEAQVENPALIDSDTNELVQAVEREVSQAITLLDQNSVQANADIVSLVKSAYEEKQTITIDYYSPYSDETTRRAIDIRLIYASNDLTYLEAYCHLDSDIRTLRMDRILRVYHKQNQCLVI